MKYRYQVFTCLIRIIFLLSVLPIPLQSQDPEQSVININNITSWVRNDGLHPWNVVGNWNGSFPKGTPAGVIFSEGIVWGGKVLDGNDPLIRVNGSTYFNGNVPISRLYRVRTHYKAEDLRDDAASFFLVKPNEVTDKMIERIYSQYEKDWNEWPAYKGAPFHDLNKSGIYEPETDIPGVPSSSQTIWINYNDDESYQSYGSPPIGVEVQETYWAYKNTKIENVIFKYIKIIYKGTELSNPDSHIDSIYIVQWVDPDVGQYTDDFVGCDTLLNIGYAYNSKNSDAVYNQYHLVSPAVGYAFLHGVAERTNNPLDSAIVDFKWHHGYKYSNSKPLTIFLSKNSGSAWTDPDPQDGYVGTLQFYNIMRGYLPRPEYPFSIGFPSPNGPVGGVGTYMQSGDPITHQGWIDGIFEGPGDRRMFLNSGPFNLNKGDTAEIAMVLVGGFGRDNLSSIAVLKLNTKWAILTYELFVEQMTSGNIVLTPPSPPQEPPAVPGNYVLHQNYPNPFNSSTIIKYNLPEPAYVRLWVYDILGRELFRLVDEEKSPGNYEVEFQAEGLSSGIYFYRITFNNLTSKLIYDNLTKTRKLIIIK